VPVSHRSNNSVMPGFHHTACDREPVLRVLRRGGRGNEWVWPCIWGTVKALSTRTLPTWMLHMWDVVLCTLVYNNSTAWHRVFQDS